MPIIERTFDRMPSAPTSRSTVSVLPSERVAVTECSVVVDGGHGGAEADVDAGLDDLVGENVAVARSPRRAPIVPGRSGPPMGGVGISMMVCPSGDFMRRWLNAKPRSASLS